MRSTPVLTVSILLGLLSCRPPGVTPPDYQVPTDTGPPGPDTDVPPGETGTESVPGVPDPSADELFDEASIPEFAIELSKESMQSLRDRPDQYVPATFTYCDQVFEEVGLRTKGSSTWQSIDNKPSLKIKFDEYIKDQEFLGLSQITLNNMVSDYSMMHERVAYRFFREAGAPAARAHHTHLTLNGQDYGLYVHTESPTRTMIARWYDDDGSLWEFWGSDFERRYIAAFELKFGEEDRTLLSETANLLAGDGPIDMKAIESTLDMESFLRYWAVCAVVAHYDGYPYRYPSDDAYLYQDPVSGQLKFLPHGVDESYYNPDFNPASDVISRLGWKCLNTSGCYERMVELIFESLDLIEAMDPLPWVDEIRTQIDPYVQSDPKRPYSYPDVVAYQQAMRDMIESRRSQLERITGR